MPDSEFVTTEVFEQAIRRIDERHDRAWDMQERHDEEHNNLLEQMRDRESGFLSKANYEERHQELVNQITVLRETKSGWQGRMSGMAAVGGLILSVLLLLGAQAISYYFQSSAREQNASVLQEMKVNEQQMQTQMNELNKKLEEHMTPEKK